MTYFKDHLDTDDLRALVRLKSGIHIAGQRQPPPPRGGDLDFAAWRTSERAAAITWARRLLDDGRFVIVDTETTGLDERAEAVEVAILSADGSLEVVHRLRPRRPIPAAATKIHGITEAMVEDAPIWPQLHAYLCQILHPTEVIAYNAEYDVRILRQSAAAWDLAMPVHRHHCAMLEYARFIGDWNANRQSWRWQKLPPIDGQTAHSALGDCYATRAMIRRMAEAKEE